MQRACLQATATTQRSSTFVPSCSGALASPPRATHKHGYSAANCCRAPFIAGRISRYKGRHSKRFTTRDAVLHPGSGPVAQSSSDVCTNRALVCAKNLLNESMSWHFTRLQYTASHSPNPTIRASCDGDVFAEVCAVGRVRLSFRC